MRPRALRIALVLLLLAATGAIAEDRPLHGGLDRLLRAHVKDGLVDYSGLKKDVETLDAYLARLAAAKPADMKKKERLAFWINAYNAFTLKLVIDHYPGIESIKEIERPWKRKAWLAGGSLRSLDEIEHQILRKEFAEPRIHFAIVCASVSCPVLAGEAYTAEKLDAQLDAAARRLIRDEKRGLALRDGDPPIVRVSALFDWFAKDFERNDDTVIAVVSRFAGAKARAWIEKRRESLEIRYLPWDWSLNSR